MILYSAAFAALAGCSAPDTPKAADGSSAVAASVPLILVVGTSLTAGLGLDPSEAYPAVLQQKIDSAGLAYRVVNRGVSGETSAGALQRVDWLMRQPVAVLILETGANDGLRGLDPDSLRANIDAIVGRCRQAYAAGHPLLGMEAPPNLRSEYTARFRPSMRMRRETPGTSGAVSARRRRRGRFAQPGPGDPPDGGGLAAVAELVWEALLPLLQQSGSR
jgi:acyl-CoA thioesterase-1